MWKKEKEDKRPLLLDRRYMWRKEKKMTREHQSRETRRYRHCTNGYLLNSHQKLNLNLKRKWEVSDVHRWPSVPSQRSPVRTTPSLSNKLIRDQYFHYVGSIIVKPVDNKKYLYKFHHHTSNGSEKSAYISGRVHVTNQSHIIISELAHQWSIFSLLPKENIISEIQRKQHARPPQSWPHTCQVREKRKWQHEKREKVE